MRLTRYWLLPRLEPKYWDFPLCHSKTASALGQIWVRRASRRPSRTAAAIHARHARTAALGCRSASSCGRQKRPLALLIDPLIVGA